MVMVFGWLTTIKPVSRLYMTVNTYMNVFFPRFPVLVVRVSQTNILDDFWSLVSCDITCINVLCIGYALPTNWLCSIMQYSLLVVVVRGESVT